MLVRSKLTRFIHWIIALALILNLFFLEEGDTAHEYVGYTAVAFVLVRFIYGLTSKGSASFKYFPISPNSVKEFVLTKIKAEKKDYAGHNPLASIVYILIWMCVLGLGVTGWMMGLDKYFGEEWLEEIHANISLFVQALIILHFIGIALDSYTFKRKTWMAMITGKKI